MNKVIQEIGALILLYFLLGFLGSYILSVHYHVQIDVQSCKILHNWIFGLTSFLDLLYTVALHLKQEFFLQIQEEIKVFS